jgi:type I restriction enzyme S subunit
VPSNRVYARFLKYFAEGPLYWKQLYAACSGTGQPNVNGTSLSQLHLALPPIPEQHRIVAKIDQLMARCDELEKLRAERKQKRLAIHTVALRQLLAVQEQDSSANAWQFLTRHFSELYSVKENVAELRKAILQLAVMGRLVPQDPSDPSANELLERIAAEKQRLVKEKKIKVTNPLSKINMEEEPFALPEGWVWCRFQDVFISIKYGTSKKCEYNGGLIPVLRIPNISNGSVLLDDLKSTDLGSKEVADLSLEKHDILIIRSNGSVSLVGRSAVVDNNAVGFSYAGYLMRIRVFNNQVSSNYLHNVLQSPMTRVAIEGPIRTTSGVKNVNSTEISQLKISLPPLPEQHRIVAKIDKLMALCDTLDQQIDATTGKQTELLNAVMAQV